MPEWFDRDAFWAEFRPVLFDEARWAGAAEQVDQLLVHLKVDRGAALLDLCCGPGRHALELARRGYVVTGVDRTAEYLDSARGLAVSEDLAIDFVQEDMRRFVRPSAYDGAYNVFTSFGYFDDPHDDRSVLEHLYGSLKPGARLVLDMIGKEIIARSFRERDWSWLDEQTGSIFIEERKLSRSFGWIDNTWTIIQGSDRRVGRFSLRLYAATELESLLRSVGFADVETFGHLDGSPYDHRARRLVAVARKGEGT